MSHPSIIIIGGGFSGAALAAQLLAHGANAPNVVLIDRSGRLGPGLAYSTTHAAHLMNVRASKLSFYPDRPNDFSDWLRKTDPIAAPATPFASRMAYGAYIEAQLRRAARMAPPGALTLLRDSAVACRTDKDGVVVTLASGARLQASAAVLALGNLPAQPPAALRGAPLIDPWDHGALSRIRPCENVLLLGTGLTMVDVALSIASGPRSGAMLALSRRGLVSRAHAGEDAAPAPAPRLPSALGEAVRTLRREIAAAAARDEPWQWLLDRLRPETSTFWRGLTLVEQKRFLRHLRPWWNSHRHRMPPHIAAWLRALENVGSLKVAAGALTSVDASDGRTLRVTYRPRGATALETFETAHIVNCLGACEDVHAAPDPLLRQMLGDGLVRAHATGMGLDLQADGGVIDLRGQAQQRLFALGPLAQGALLETTAIAELRAQARALAQRLTAFQDRHHAALVLAHGAGI